MKSRDQHSENMRAITIRTIDIYRPYCPVVSIVRPQPLAVMCEPDVDNVVF